MIKEIFECFGEFFVFSMCMLAIIFVFGWILTLFGVKFETYSEDKAFCESVEGSWSGENCWKNGEIIVKD